MSRRKQKKNLLYVKMFGFLLGLCLAVWMHIGAVYAEETGNTGTTGDEKLKNGSFEDGQTWWAENKTYNTQGQSAIPGWNTTASDGNIELFGKNKGTYIINVELVPKEGTYAAELNANEESTLYQNVKTTPSSIYEWGLDHGARNGTDTMALVIGPKQEVDPTKPSSTGRDQFMQMVDWLIAQGKTTVKTSAGLGEQLVVYSKKFAEKGTFQDNTGNNAFSLTPSAIYTEEWHIWIMASSRATSGTNPWESYGSNAEVSNSNTGGTSNTELDLSKYYLYTVPAGQTETLFGFVSVGCVNSTTSADKAKTFGNFLDNIKFEIYHPLSGSSTLHGSGVVGGSDGTATGGGGLSTGYEVTVDKKLITYVADNGKPLKVQAVVKKSDVEAGCEFVGMNYTKQTQNESGDLVLTTSFLQLAGNEIADTGNLTDAEKKNKWIKSTNSNGDIIYTYYLENITSATNLHFVFIKSPTITYDSNGGKPYVVERTYNTDEAANVYSYKPVAYEPYEVGRPLRYIPPYVSHAAEGQNDGWKFMGWLLTGDTVASTEIPQGISQINKDKLGTFLLPAEHTIACDYSGETTKKEQYFKIWNNKDISPTEDTDYTTCVKWQTNKTPDYANIHKGLTLVAQWRWRQAFVPQKKTGTEYNNSEEGGTVEIVSVANRETNDNYNGAFNGTGGKAYYAETNEVVTVVATAKDGYTFEGWYDDAGHLLTTQATYSYTEIKEKVGTFYARFSKPVTQTYIRQVKNGDTWETIQGDADHTAGNLDLYTYTDVAGTSISAMAIAKTGYKCIGWFDENGNPVEASMLSSDKTTIRYVTTGNAKYYARFEKKVTQTYIRQVKDGDTWKDIEGTSDNEAGNLTRYTHSDIAGQTVNSKATAGDGYEFIGWFDENGDPVEASMLSSDKTTIRYVTTGDATYYARFEKKVTQKFVRQVKDGEGWTDIADNENATYDSIGTLTCYTNFEIAGESVSSIAAAGTGYEFLGWYDANGTLVATSMLSEDKTTIRYVTTGDATYYARFEKIKVLQTYVRQEKDGDGWKDITDDDIAYLDRYTYETEWGNPAGAVATAGDDYTFLGWYDGEGHEVADTMISGEGNILSYTATKNATYYARFQSTETPVTPITPITPESPEIVTQTYACQIKSGETWENMVDSGKVSVTCEIQTGEAGTIVSVTAEAGAGYEFLGWFDADGNPVAAGMLSADKKTIRYTITENARYYARFSPNAVVEDPDEPDTPEDVTTETTENLTTEAITTTEVQAPNAEIEPGKSDKAEVQESTNESAKTGDTAMPVAVGGIMISAFAMIVLLGRNKKKQFI